MEIRHRIEKCLKKRMLQNTEQREIYKDLLL